MLSQIMDDFYFLLHFFLKKINILKFKIFSMFDKRKNHIDRNGNKGNIIQCLMEFEGAKKLGGEYLGKKEVNGFPVFLYRLRRQSYDETTYFYVAYILRNNKHSYQFVLHEEWLPFNELINKIVKTNKPFIIGIKSGERGKAYAKRKTRLGRKIL